MIYKSSSSQQTLELGIQIGKKLRAGDILALQGTLAAGKTTLTKGIALGLNITEDITSPTFTLISEYPASIPLYHMDVYRLDSVEDFINLGVEDLLYGNGISIIEWSEKIMEELPSSTIIIAISILENNDREIQIKNWPYGDIQQ